MLQKKVNVIDGGAQEHLPGVLSRALLFSLAVDVPHVRGRLAEGDDGGPDSSVSPPPSESASEMMSMS